MNNLNYSREKKKQKPNKKQTNAKNVEKEQMNA